MDEATWLYGDNPSPMLEWLTADKGPSGHYVRHGQVADRKLRLFGAACVRQVWHLLDERCRVAVCSAERFADDEIRYEDLFDERNLIDRCPPGWGMPLPRHIQAVRWLCSPSARNATRAWGCVRDTVKMQMEEVFADTANLLRDVIGNPYRPVTVTKLKDGDYDPTFGDDRVCVCGHIYYRHFDSWEDMRPVGCKYCQCRTFTYAPHWITPTVLHLAEVAYQGRSPDSGHLDPVCLAVLADALEEAGCSSKTCEECKGAGRIWVDHPPVEPHWNGCHDCNCRGMVYHEIVAHLRDPGPHVRGCWAIDLITGRE